MLDLRVQFVQRFKTIGFTHITFDVEGALPSVVGERIPAPIIVVPTSVGYGANFGGLSTLLGMLTACAPGITVVNIDNGFGAATVAHRILQLML